MNLVVLNGRLTRDPELKFGQSGKAYSRFSIAVDRPFSSGNNGGQTVDFINCVAFGKTAEFIGEYFRKGKKILLNGTLQMNQYEKDGQKITTYVVIANNVEFGESKASEGNSSYSTNSESSYSKPTRKVEEPSFEEDSSVNLDDDEFPF
ncbi:MAG: single-stranded DNA-binding protein [Fusobacterium sp.]|nr:single-stranded DNA-binding protein [Fusobacterium sp.]